MRPRREPGSGFTERLRVDLRPPVPPHRVQRAACRRAGRDPLPHVHGQRLAGGEPPAIREFRQRRVDALGLEPRGDLLREQPIERLELHHASHLRRERPLHGDAALVAVAVLVRRAPELAGVTLVGPIRSPDPMRRRKLNDTRKIADRHRQNTRTALALNENTTGLPGASARSRTASSVTTAMSSTPTSAVTCTAPGPRRASPVTRP